MSLNKIWFGLHANLLLNTSFAGPNKILWISNTLLQCTISQWPLLLCTPLVHCCHSKIATYCVSLQDPALWPRITPSRESYTPNEFHIFRSHGFQTLVSIKPPSKNADIWLPSQTLWFVGLVWCPGIIIKQAFPYHCMFLWRRSLFLHMVCTWPSYVNTSH